MNKDKLKEIIEIPWVLLETGFWATVATYRDIRVRYLEWRIRRVEQEINADKQGIKQCSPNKEA